jgi:uncharacterized protein (TIGR03437 family)
MDAAQKLLKASAILLAFALLMAAPGWAITLNVPSTTVAIPVASRVSDPVSVTSSASPATEITFATSIDYAGDVAWLNVSGGATTPTTLTFTALNVGGFSATVHTATVTLTPSSPAGVAAVQITVIYDNTGGGGGGSSTSLSASSTTVALTSLTTFAPVTITNISSNAVSVTASVTTASATWLTVSLVPNIIVSGGTATLGITANTAGLAATTYQGIVTLTPTSGTALPITVNLTVGSSGGGSWLVSPSTVPWSYTTNTGVFPTPASIAVTATTGSSSYTVNTTQNSSLGHWLLVAANGQLPGILQAGIPVGAPFTLSAGIQANSLTQGTYTDQAIVSDQNGVQQATVTVTLTVNGGASSGLTLNPSTLQFSAAVGGAQQSLIVTVTSSTGGFFSVNGCNSVTWLTCALPSNTNLSPNVGAALTVYTNTTGLTANTYTGTLQVQVGSQIGTVSVSFAVGSGTGAGSNAVVPTQLNFAYELGTNPSFIARQLLVITGPAGAWSAVTSVTSPEGGNWLGISPSSGTALPDPSKPTAAPVVTIDPTGLGPNLYGGSITVKTPGGTQVIQVLLNVYASTIILPNPVATLIFTATTGQPKPSPQGLFWSDSDNALDTSTITATANNSWITLSNPSPGTVTVNVDQSTLSAGVYSGSVALTQTGAANSPDIVPILLVVGGGSGGGTLTFSPSPITFTSASGSTPAPATLAVGASTATAFSATIAYTNGSGWLTVSPQSGTTPANLTVSANPAGLTAGTTYNAIISFTTTGGVQTVNVSFTVSNGNTGNVTVLPTSLTFTVPQGSSPANQTLSVSSAAGSAGISFSVTPMTSSGGSWLSSSVSAGTTPLNPLTIQVNSSALPAATYQGNILIAPIGGTTVNIPVTLNVTAAASISATPTSLTFDYRLGDAAPAAKQVTVSGTGATFTATATSPGNWLVVTPTTGTAPGTVNVSINKANVTSTGTLNGTVVVAATGGSSGSTTVNVALNVTSLPTISSVNNAASYTSNAVSPGEIITLFANDPAHPIGPATPAYLTLDANGNVATSLGGVQVTVAGYNCPMIYASASQVSAVVPYEVKIYPTANVLVKYLGQGSNGVLMNVATTVPGLFTFDSSGAGPGAILNSDLGVNTAANPAARGDIVVLYMTGEGETSPNGVTGKVTTVASPPAPLTPAPLLPISVTIGGQPAQWTFAGEAPGLVSGVLQVNVVVPNNIAAGNQPVVVTIGGVPSQPRVTVSLK